MHPSFHHVVDNYDNCSTTDQLTSLLMGVGFAAEDYWIDNPAAEVRVPASFHLGYGGQLPALESAIRALHAKVLSSPLA